MQRPFPAYRGDSPYVFVTYAHADAAEVYPLLTWLRERGVNIWYDEGIDPGSNWRAKIGTALDGAGHVLLFISRAALASEHCNREINYALDQDKHILPVLLDDTPLTADLRIGLTRVQMIRRADHDADGLRTILLRGLGGLADAEPPADEQPPARGRRHLWAWLVAAGVAVLVAAWPVVEPTQRDGGRAEAPPEAVAVDAQPVAAAARTIAVLPFVNFSADPEQAFFADGLAEEVLNRLTREPRLKVTSRTSAFVFRGQDVDIPTIAATLGVAHVLEGSVRRAGDRIRVTAQLIEVASDAHLWSETYERGLDDIFAVQDDIAERVASALNVALLGATRAERVDPAAYENYLHARHLLRSGDPNVRERAGDLLRAALAIEPDYVRALTELVRYHSRRWREGTDSYEVTRAAIGTLVERALQLDPRDAVALAFRASAYATVGDLENHGRFMTRALTVDPTNVEVLRSGISTAIRLGRLDDAIRIGRYVTERDPLCHSCLEDLSSALRLAGRYDEAAERAGVAMRLEPTNPVRGFSLAVAVLRADPERALALVRADQPHAWGATVESLALLRLGRGTEARAQRALVEANWGDAMPLAAALLAAAWGEADAAFGWLDRQAATIHQRLDLLGTLLLSPNLAVLHDDPRWHAYLERIGATPERLAAVEFTYTLPE